MPNLLVAPLSPTIPADDPYKEYEQGYYADGAYTAVPDLSPTRTCRNGIDQVEVDPQEAYYASLCDRFAALSSALRLSPHSSATLTTSTAFNPSSRASWRRFIVNMQPTSLIVSKLRQEEVMHGLEVLETVLSMANMQRHKNIGLWAWGLLARCRDVGEMGSEEVGVLRDLGKKAIAVLRGVTAGLYRDHSENGENDDEDKGEEEPESQTNADADADADAGADANANGPAQVSESRLLLSDSAATSLDDSPHVIEAAKQLLLKSLTEESPGEVAIAETMSLGSQPAHAVESERESGREEAKKIVESETPICNGGKQEDDEKSFKMHVTLDMIITIVGELYGQKDLLQGRLLWDEMDTAPIRSEGT